MPGFCVSHQLGRMNEESCKGESVKPKKTVYFYYLTPLEWLRIETADGREDNQRPTDCLVAVRVTETDHYAINRLMYSGQVIYRSGDKQSIEKSLTAHGIPDLLTSNLKKHLFHRSEFSIWSDEIQGDGDEP